MRRAVEPHDPDGHAALHAADQRLLERYANHCAAVSLFFMHDNLGRKHRTLQGKTPAMVAGLADHVGSAEKIAGLLDAAS